ncbi:MAG: hypothetical protein H6622_05045 [Halobacteriovoraceae bacterium]|nr:hypothetical protein [Halobacteriovoraceae bacterium]
MHWILVLLFLVLNLYSSRGLTRIKHEIKFKNKIQILSDKAIRKTSENFFEAVGNVFITSQDNSIYGDKASLDMTTGDIEVKGNVRYVSSGLQLFGSKILYNSNTTLFTIENARVVSPEFSVFGKIITKKENGNFYAKDAEYTKCRDCPELWSLTGEEIEIEIGQYVTIKHAYVKVKESIVAYVPYIFFPIKKSRETGLLYPSFFSRPSQKENDKTFNFYQPIYFVTGQTSDITLTPTFMEERGIGFDVEYRKVFTPFNWAEFNYFSLNDNLYYFESGLSEQKNREHYRFFGQWEHHFQRSNYLNHHLVYNFLSDLDTVDDYSEVATNDSVIGGDLGLYTYFDLHFFDFSFITEVGMRKNMITPDRFTLDHNYVQMLPRLTIKSYPISLFSSHKFLIKDLSFKFHSEGTIFKQNRINEVNYLRNAYRLNTQPELELQLRPLGPFLFSTKTIFDGQYYKFFHLKNEKNTFSKNAFLLESQIQLGIDKIFGHAYVEKYLPSDINLERQKTNEKSPNSEYIGDVPQKGIEYQDNVVLKNVDSYMHSQDFFLRHFYLFDESMNGNQRFANQISDEQGLFDEYDAIRSKQHESISITTLPKKNTLELFWQNNLIRKSVKVYKPFQDKNFLRDQFSYSEVAYFNVSQGILLNSKSSDDLDQKLTRLAIFTGFNLDNYSISISNYYYYRKKTNIFRTDFLADYKTFDLKLYFYRDTEQVPQQKTLGGSVVYDVNDNLKLGFALEYDYNLSKMYKQIYSMRLRLFNCVNLAFDIEPLPNTNEYKFSISPMPSIGETDYDRHHQIAF